MTPKEREDLKKLDELILNASSEELAKIQSIDLKNQLEGVSLYEMYIDSSSLQQSIKKSPKRSSQK